MVDHPASLGSLIRHVKRNQFRENIIIENTWLLYNYKKSSHIGERFNKNQFFESQFESRDARFLSLIFMHRCITLRPSPSYRRV